MTEYIYLYIFHLVFEGVYPHSLKPTLFVEGKRGKESLSRSCGAEWAEKCLLYLLAKWQVDSFSLASVSPRPAGAAWCRSQNLTAESEDLSFGLGPSDDISPIKWGWASGDGTIISSSGVVLKIK